MIYYIYLEIKSFYDSYNYYGLFKLSFIVNANIGHTPY